MSKVPYLRIATEEAFAPPEMLVIFGKILAKKDVDPGFKGLMGFYMSSPSARDTYHALFDEFGSSTAAAYGRGGH